MLPAREAQGHSSGCSSHGCHRVRGVAGQGAAIPGDRVLPSPGDRVLPAAGAGCCRIKAQRDGLLPAPAPTRSAQPKWQSFAAAGEGRYPHRTAGSPGRAPGCPGQDGEAAAAGPPPLPSLPQESGAQGAPGARRCPARVEKRGGGGAVPGS